MKPNNPTVTLRGRKLRETGKAAQFRIEWIGDLPLEPSKDEWFPFSQISKMTHDPAVNPPDTMIVSKWIMEQKELSVVPVKKVSPEDMPFYDPPMEYEDEDEDSDDSPAPWEY